ncbi:PTS mannose transporter subunit IIA [Tetragenococcus osmophilus]|uniref:PTS mannose transporter subunit IIA n=1 Tax=Tetragenococcus osmophilus TaxID=526944 RepID=A0AA37XN04_9ENTE|nr:PTS mannose transporter subunit IIA [Tetragenococcus osmophilus]AYW47289.1 PTS mannose transporter subunit IIA [Tetragenococcus osmophilus]GMA52817.1 PTS mannose transporter subunit IIA [Alicyclobacillus contaminans]GMA73185.1 PTS mannose transporter subunit IIA [Tetragenococcus osmophilus]
MKYLIATHGEFSKGIIDAAQLIAGNNNKIDYFSMTKSKGQEEAEEEVKNYLAKTQGQELVVLTDVFGGSVANLFTNFLLNGYKFQLVTGVNLPLVLTLLLSADTDSNTLIKNSIEEAKKGIVYINELIEKQGGDHNDDRIIED